MKKPRVPEVRLYVDESGDHASGLAPNSAWDKRYLGITGVAIKMEVYRTRVQPELEALKQRFFPHNPDEPLVLVRRKIINKEGPFGRLSDPTLRAEWESSFLSYFNDVECQLFTVVIDKASHHEIYGKAMWHPYNYAFTVLIERYRGWLDARNMLSDVMVEARGGAEDRILRGKYAEIYSNGTHYLAGHKFRDVLTSKDLKLKPKSANIAGLQLADLLAHACKCDVLVRYSRLPKVSETTFSDRLIQIARKKMNAHGRVLLDPKTTKPAS